MFSGAGSVDVSARATFATAYSTSGNDIRTAFCFAAIFVFSSQRDARIGDRHEHQIAFVQRRHELAADAARDERARPTNSERGSGDRQQRDARARLRAPAGRAAAARASPGWRLRRGNVPPSSSVHSTGTSVTAMTVAARTANVLVNASG